MQKGRLLFLLALIVFISASVSAQTTEFAYQGSLKDGAITANGNYDFEFRLYDALTVGTQHPTVVSRSNVAVSNGTFTVKLDFFSALVGAFPGADRYLEILVKNAGGPNFTTLTPRQKISGEPYAQKSLASDTATTAINSLQLGGVGASQYVTTTNGGTNFVQNTTTTQPTSNFNITGNGTAGGTLSGGAVNTATQYNIGGLRVLSTAGISNLFVGVGAGGGVNTGIRNSFFGSAAGDSNTTGDSNSFFGTFAGSANTTGGNNAFVGYGAGSVNTMGGNNSFVGRFAGLANTVGNNNTVIGDNADLASGNLSFATAIGSEAIAIENNSVTLGRSADIVYVPGFLRLVQLGGGGTTALCRNNANTIGPCSSSLRYKTNIEPFTSSLDLINRLKPITFDWKEGGMHDLGLAAEDVEKVEPLLVTYNDKGQVEGVKYDRIGVVLVNAVKEQQAQIEELKQIVCGLKPDAKICSPK